MIRLSNLMKQILLFAMALISLPLFGRDSKEAQFWNWFQKNEDTVFHFEKDRERVFDQLGTALQAVNPDLTFEFGPVTSDGEREFVISAGGIKSVFPAVEAVAQSAPPLPRWIIVKYRQRRNPTWSTAGRRCVQPRSSTSCSEMINPAS